MPQQLSYVKRIRHKSSAVLAARLRANEMSATGTCSWDSAPAALAKPMYNFGISPLFGVVTDKLPVIAIPKSAPNWDRTVAAN